MTDQYAKEMFSLSPAQAEVPKVVETAPPESLGSYIDAFGGMGLLAVLGVLAVAVIAYVIGKRMAPSAPRPNVLVTTNWWAIAKLWSVQGGVLIAAVSTWYANYPEAQALISGTVFANGVALANLAVIVLRNLNQKSEVPEGVVHKRKAKRKAKPKEPTPPGDKP